MSVLTPTNISFILQGLWLTIYISFIAIVLSTLIGTVLAVMRNGKIRFCVGFQVFILNLSETFQTCFGFSLFSLFFK